MQRIDFLPWETGFPSNLLFGIFHELCGQFKGVLTESCINFQKSFLYFYRFWMQKVLRADNLFPMQEIPPWIKQKTLYSLCCRLCLNTAGTYSPRLWTGWCSCFLSSPFRPAAFHRWGERSAGGETGCWSCSGNPWSLFWFHPKNLQSPLCTSWSLKQVKHKL